MTAADWQRLFNRLDAAISHHKRDQGDTPFASDADERLYAARDRILRDASEQAPSPAPEADMRGSGPIGY